MRHRGRWIVRVTTAVALSVPSAGVLATPAHAATALDCSTTLVAGVRGSGETQADYWGFGQTVVTELAAFQGTYGAAVTPVAVDYPAAPISVLLQPGGLATYLGSVNQGVSALLTTLLAAAASCPAQPVVLLGYSQGAMVVHEALDLAQTVWPALLDRVAGVGLVADPLRLGGQPYEFGTASADREGLALAFGVAPPTDLPAAVRDHTRSACNDGDPVCAFDLFDFHPDVHTAYATNGYALVTGFLVGLLAKPVVIPT